MKQENLKLAAVGQDNNLIYNMHAVHDFMRKGASINSKIDVLSYITDRQDSRMTVYES
jgi:hypothetical protein